MPLSRRLAALTPLLLLPLASTGCQSASPEPVSLQLPAVSTGDFPRTVLGDIGQTVVPAPPRRIVSVSPSATETLYAIGAGGAVVAVDSRSDHPAGAPRTRLSAMTPDPAAIAALAPDLVVLERPGAVGELTARGIPSLVLGPPADLDEAYTQMQMLGAVTDHLGEASDLVAATRGRLIAAQRRIATAASLESLSVFHEVSADRHGASTHSFVGSVYAQLGLANATDEAMGAVAPDLVPPQYPRLADPAIRRVDPAVIVLADIRCCAQSATTVAARPGWTTIRAIRSGQVLEVDDDLASRWGPRVADFGELVAARLRPSGDPATSIR